MAAFELVKFRVYIEGVLVPNVSSISVTQNKHESSSAVITMPPPPGFRFEELKRARVHIFWSDRAIRDSAGDDPRKWPILFEGEVASDTLSKSSSSRDGMLTCVGYNSYWEQVLYYFFDFSAGAFARWPSSDSIKMFLGNEFYAANLNVAGADLQARIGEIVKNEINKPYPAIVKELFGGSLTSNHFFQLADENLRLSDRFVSVKDQNLKTLIKNAAFLSLVEQNVVTMDGTSSIMSVLREMLKIFRYGLTQNCQPRVIKFSDDDRNSSAQRERVRTEQELVLKQFGDSIGIKIDSLDELSLDETSTDTQVKNSAAGKVQKFYESELQANVSDERRTEVAALVNEQSAKLEAQMIVVRDKIKDAGDKKRSIEDGFLESKSILSQFIMLPDTRFVSVPECNVFFPCSQTSFSFTRNHLQEPTRYAMILREVANIPVGQPVYFAPRNIPGTAVSSYSSNENGVGRAKVPRLMKPSSSKSGYSPPVSGPINLTSPFGQRSVEIGRSNGRRTREGSPDKKATRAHLGIDLGTGGSGVSINRRPVLAMDDGKVKVSKFVGGYGNFIRIEHDNGLATHYAHLDEFLAFAGQRVKRGQIIGRVGATGGDFLPHLHFEVLNGGVRVDPVDFVISAIVSNNIPDGQVNLNHARQNGNMAKLAAARAAAAETSSEDGALSESDIRAAIAESVTPEAGRDEDLSEAVLKDESLKEYQFLTPEEEVKGIIPYFDYDFDPTIALLANDQDADRDDYIQSIVEAEFLNRRFESRNASPLNGPFNPHPIAGFPGLVVDKHRSVICMVDSVSHMITASGSASTTVSPSAPRYWDEGDPYHWRGGKPGNGNAVFPSYFLQDFIDTNSYTIDPEDEIEGPPAPGVEGEAFGVGRDRPVDKVYQAILGCRAIPYYYGTRVDEATGLEVAYNKAIGAGEGSLPRTITGKYFSLSEDSFDAAEAFSSSFTRRLGATLEEIIEEFLGCTSSTNGTEYTGDAFRPSVQDEVRRLNTLLNEDAFRG